MRTHILSLSLLAVLSVASISAFAEPPVQAGETLESLSKAKVTTTVNGQPGSLQELVASGQVQLLNDPSAQPAVPTQTAPAQEGVAVGEPQTHNEPVAAQPEVNTEAPQVAEPAL